jgi:bla regulator protein blaR1
MTERVARTPNRTQNLLVLAAASIALTGLPALGQTNTPLATMPAWQKAAGGKMAFEVASIHQTKPGEFTPPNMGLDNGDGYRPTGGLFKADFPLFVYITFAYKIRLTEEQAETMVAHLPQWIVTDNYEIHARGPVNATKDQMRLMMQSLLAERFKLAVHFETQQAPIFLLTLIVPTKTGPMLRPHADCDGLTSPPASPMSTDVFPPVCISYGEVPKPNHVVLSSSRNNSLSEIAESLSDMGGLGRPVRDQTGLKERYDYSIEWTPDSELAATASADGLSGSQGTSFRQAMKEQLGLKLEPSKAPVTVIVVDQMERPSEN